MKRPTISHIDHIVLFISNIERTREFYSVLLGDPIINTSKLLKYSVGSTDIFFCLPNNRSEKAVYNKDSVGVNHLALYVEHANLVYFSGLLTNHQIAHSGIQIDRHSGNDYIWFDDPDNIRIELFSRNVC